MNLIRLIVSAAVLGAAVGAGIGLLISLARKKGNLDKSFLIDALLGAIGFAGSRIVLIYAPIHGETITRHVGNAIISTTTKRYQYPNQIAFPVAILLPLLYEFFVNKRASQPRM
jgi:hypothetical protein